MVSTMFRAVQERDPGFHGCSAGFGGEEEEEEEEGEGWIGSSDDSDLPGPGPGAAIERAAGACVLWSTVAVGCLIGGRPKSSVSSASNASRCSRRWGRRVRGNGWGAHDHAILGRISSKTSKRLAVLLKTAAAYGLSRLRDYFFPTILYVFWLSETQLSKGRLFPLCWQPLFPQSSTSDTRGSGLSLPLSLAIDWSAFSASFDCFLPQQQLRETHSPPGR